jgi:hypothetical protein
MTVEDVAARWAIFVGVILAVVGCETRVIPFCGINGGAPSDSP